MINDSTQENVCFV
ncbi:hypothetical protein ACROYT_G024543 [Oculina patagonica]